MVEMPVCQEYSVYCSYSLSFQLIWKVRAGIYDHCFFSEKSHWCPCTLFIVSSCFFTDFAGTVEGGNLNSATWTKKYYIKIHHSSRGSSSLNFLCGCLCLNFLMASVLDSASTTIIMYRESRLDQYSNSYFFISSPPTCTSLHFNKMSIYYIHVWVVRSTTTLKELTPANGGSMCDNNCSAVQVLTVPLRVVWVQVSLSFR